MFLSPAYRRPRTLFPFLLTTLVAFCESGVSNAEIPSNGCPYVEHLPQVVVIYWSATGTDDYWEEASFDAQFLNESVPLQGGSGLIGSQYNGMLSQYFMGTGRRCSGHLPNVNGVRSVTPAPVVVTNPPPPGPGVDSGTASAMEQSLISDIGAKYPSNTIFVLQYAPNTTWPSNACAYHSWTSNSIPYISLPYATLDSIMPCGGPTVFDAQAGNLNHEYAETVSDPLGTGWIDSNGAEIGDVCNTTDLHQIQVLPTGSSPAFHVGVQALWSNNANQGNGACVFAQMSHTMNYYLGGDGQIWEQYDAQNSATALGAPSGAFSTAPTVATWGRGRVDLFAFTAQNHLGHLYQLPGGTVGSDDWGAPAPGLRFNARPGAASWGYGRLDVFGNVFKQRPRYELMLHKSWDNGAQTGWVGMPSLPATFISAPAAVSSGYSNLDVVNLATDGNLYHSSSSDGTSFSAWASLGQPGGGVTLTGDPAIASWGPGRFDVFLVNSAGTLSHYWSDSNAGTSGWDTWAAPGYVFSGSPTATTMGDDRLAVSAVTSQGGFVQFLYDFGKLTVTPSTANFAPVGQASTITYSAE